MPDGVPGMFENIFWAVKNQVEDTLGMLVFILLLRIVLRRTWLALAGFVLIAVIAFGPGSSHLVYDKLFVMIVAICFTFALVRFGLLAVCVGTFLLELSQELPMTLDFSLWYSNGFFALLLVTAGLLAYGFRFSLAGQSMFADSTLDG